MFTAHRVRSARAAVVEYGGDIPDLTFNATDAATLQVIADAYGAMPDMDYGALPAWRALERETWGQLGALQRAGISLEVVDTDPYATPAELFADLENGRIQVLATRATGGHPVWSDDSNDAFRAVHDVMGHAATGRGFDRHGEAAAYAHHRTLYSPLARLALATELRGQAATLAATGEFPAQKIAILPAHLHTAGLFTDDAAALADAVARHTAAGLSLA